MAMTDYIEIAISEAIGRPFRIDHRQAAGAGCINITEIVEGNGQKYFVKLNDASRLDMYVAEAAGLAEIIRSNTVRAPKPIVSGKTGAQAYLVLEFLDLTEHTSTRSDAVLGRQLAAMHRVTQPEFGWWRNNTIGTTAQNNHAEQDWVIFYREHRLRFQFELAARKKSGANLLRGWEQLLEKLPVYFADYKPLPSLLHGDLWGGNHATLSDGTPVIYDPAVYYGDREADIAMTELFGGYGAEFYAAYNESWPLDPGYRTRRALYNLYHVLNHLNLFGGGYRGQAQQLIDRLLSDSFC